MLVTRLFYGPVGSWLGKRNSRRLANCVAIGGPLVVANAAILARLADVILHDVHWGRTRRSVALDAIDRLDHANGKAISAIVLNRVTPAKYRKYNWDGGWALRHADCYGAASATAASKP